MSTTVRSRGTRRIAAGIGLIGFPALLVIQGLVDPTDDTTFYAAAVSHPDTLLYSALLLLASAVLTIPAIGGILHMAGDRGALLADLGAVFALLGALGHTALSVIYLLMRSLDGGQPAEMIGFEDRLNADPSLSAVGLVLLVSFGLGLTLLSWASWRAGLIGWWGPAVITGVALVHIFYPGDVPMIAQIAALCAIAVVFGWLGIRVLALSNEEWNPTMTLTVSNKRPTSPSVA